MITISGIALLKTTLQLEDTKYSYGSYCILGRPSYQIHLGLYVEEEEGLRIQLHTSLKINAPLEVILKYWSLGVNAGENDGGF